MLAFPTTHANGELVDAAWANDLENRAAAAIAAASGAITVSSPGNLGASQTINFASTVGETWLVGTLNANCTVTLSNRVTGCRAYLLVTQDGTGSRTLTVSDGSVNQLVPIASTLGQFSMIEVKCPDASTIDVATIGVGTSAWAQRDQAKYNAMGLQGQTYDLFGASAGVGGGVSPGSQVLLGTLIGLLAGDVITKLYVCTATAGAGTAPTGIYLGLYSTGGTLLASTANTAASSNWTGTPQVVSFSLSAPYTVLATGGYYVAILQNGVFGTTPFKVYGPAGFAPTTEFSPSGVTQAVQQTGQATLPSTATWAHTSTFPLWMGWS